VGIITLRGNKMKAKVLKTTAEKEFKPFTLALEVESLREARLLWHVLNKKGLLDLLLRAYGEWPYSYDVNKEFNIDVFSVVDDEIESQGFEV
jgi:hypothetical protein